jgi:hypothetical protein
MNTVAESYAFLSCSLYHFALSTNTVSLSLYLILIPVDFAKQFRYRVLKGSSVCWVWFGCVVWFGLGFVFIVKYNFPVAVSIAREKSI